MRQGHARNFQLDKKSSACGVARTETDITSASFAINRWSATKDCVETARGTWRAPVASTKPVVFEAKILRLAVAGVFAPLFEGQFGWLIIELEDLRLIALKEVLARYYLYLLSSELWLYLKVSVSSCRPFPIVPTSVCVYVCFRETKKLIFFLGLCACLCVSFNEMKKLSFVKVNKGLCVWERAAIHFCWSCFYHFHHYGHFHTKVRMRHHPSPFLMNFLVSTFFFLISAFFRRQRTQVYLLVAPCWRLPHSINSNCSSLPVFSYPPHVHCLHATWS